MNCKAIDIDVLRKPKFELEIIQSVKEHIFKLRHKFVVIRIANAS